MTRPPVIRVLCDAESHAPKVAIVGRMPYRVRDGEVTHVGEEPTEELLRNDRPARGDEGPGTIDDPPRFRARHVFTCPLCGLSVQLRQENANKLVEGLVAARVFSVRLSDLAATL